MPKISEECVFTTKADQVQFSTPHENSVRIKNIKLTQEKATSLAWLVNSSAELEWKVVKKVD